MAICELLVYRLAAGSGEEFHRLMTEQSVPLQVAAGINVRFHGPSLVDPDSYMLVRKFDDLGSMADQLDRFYASEVWRAGPRTAIIDSILASHRMITDDPQFCPSR